MVHREFPEEFTADEINSFVNAYVIKEGFFAVAEPNADRTHISTFGLRTCKAIAIHNPLSKRGLLAHLSATEDLEASLTSLTEAYGDSLEVSDVSIVHTWLMTKSEAQWLPDSVGYNTWPTNKAIYEFFACTSPKSIRFDRNAQGRKERAVSLDLRSGRIGDLSPIKSLPLGVADSEDHSISLPIAAMVELSLPTTPPPAR